ncbi:MAG: hypothetical protein FJ295_20835 [Planctomycetes bacterium]|nr:hypothetical protein [Planctomycetota bacterium]
MLPLGNAWTRRRFLGTASAGLSVAGGISSRLYAGDPADVQAIIAQKLCWLADHFVAWQTPYGRLDANRIPAAIDDKKAFVLPYIASAMYRAFDTTGNAAYQTAADRYWLYYLATECHRQPALGAYFTSARAGISLIPYHDFKRLHPQESAFDDAANSLYARLLEFRWDEGSYFRNGYRGGSMDAANSDDNAAIGCGLMSYYAVTKKPEVLAHAEGLARYFLTECKPMTYQGVWSTANGNWIVAPTDCADFEHFRKPSSEISWAWTTIEAILYLTQLVRATTKDELKQGIRQKCVAGMKWQFDACQFDDGACGMSGRDDKWMGMTAGAILSFLRVRDAGMLTDDEKSTYGPKALAAREWMLRHLDEECLQRGGYWKVSGKSEPRPKCNLAWLLGWTAETLAQPGLPSLG